MNRILSISLGVALASAAFGQHNTYSSSGGFGNVLYPGTGHPPATPVPGYGRLGTIGTTIGRNYNAAPRISHPSHGRQVIVPYPVYVGGYYGGGYYSGFDAPSAGYPEQQPVQYEPQPSQPPVIIINQGYRPETPNPMIRDYSDAGLPEPTVRTYDAPTHAVPDPKERAAARAESERPTIFLIAFKDHTILPALAYWMEGDTLNYVTKEGTPNRVSISLVDRDFSRQLNRERSVDFNLP